MDYVRVSAHLSKAKAISEWWNEANPHQFVPWEWIEEMLLANHRWHSLARQRSRKALDHYARFIEFKKRIPRKLTEDLLNAQS